MIPVFLTRVKTRDGVSLEGIIRKPKLRTDRALIWVHGFTSKFYTGQTLVKELSERLNSSGVAYLKFNNRGHDIVTGWGKNKDLQGSAFEKFEDCVLDIRAVINFAKRLGYKKIYLAGHSTGANKIAHYLYKTRDRTVKGAILLGPLNDVAGAIKHIGKRDLEKRLAFAERLRNKNPHLLLPPDLALYIGIYSVSRFVSMYKPGKAEDTFPYYNPRARWKVLGNIRQPIAAIIGSRDEYLDMPLKKFIEIFHKNARKTKKFSGFVVKGANHSFIKKEKELAKIIVDWINPVREKHKKF